MFYSFDKKVVDVEPLLLRMLEYAWDPCPAEKNDYTSLSGHTPVQLSFVRCDCLKLFVCVSKTSLRDDLCSNVQRTRAIGYYH